MGAAINRTVCATSAAWMALSVASAAWAQDAGSVTDYRLPEPTRTTAAPPPVQGPVDPDNPYAAPRAERTPTPAPAPSFAPAPTITLPAVEPSRPPVRTAAERPNPRPTASATSAPSPSPQRSEAPPQPTSSTISPVVEPEGVATDTPATAPVTTKAEGTSSRWIAAVLGFVLFGTAAFIFLRRRKPTAHDTEPSLASAPEPQPVHRPEPRSEVPLPSTGPAPQAGAAAFDPKPPKQTEPSLTEPLGLATMFTPRAIRLSLVYTTLQYQLEVTNVSAEHIPPLQVRGDLASAHASLSTYDQLAPAPAMLELQGSLPELAPGATALVKGEIRIALSQVRPLVKGSASFLVPLARFCLLASNGLGSRRVFTLGPLDAGGSAVIKPVRLDAGPRNLRELTAREVEAARAFTLDPVPLDS